MPALQELTGAVADAGRSRSAAGAWPVSLPLLMALAAYAYLIFNGQLLLRDGDTYWHVAAGQWILQHHAVPATDPFSYTMPGAAWTAHEWLAEVVFALAHDAGGWTLVVAAAALAFAAAVGVLTRALLERLEPIYAFLFGALAIFMSAGHALARPHLLAMPLMVTWAVGLTRAADERRAPSPWLLPVMVLWANLHAGFMLGLGLAGAFAFEAVLAAFPDRRRMASAALPWTAFVLLAILSALLTPQGLRGFQYLWLVLAHSTYALDFIGEWQSPNFHVFQPLALWLLGGLALVMYQGLRLPPVRLALLLGLLYGSLKYARNIELLGMLAPLVIAAPLAAQWRERRANARQVASADEFFLKLARPAGPAALALAAAAFVAAPLWLARAHPIEPPAGTAPTDAVRAARQAGVRGPVLNEYDWGGYLIHSGIPVFIDGRGEMYGDEFLKAYVQALQLARPDALEQLLRRYRVAWTLLRPGTPAVALLDRLPGWRRVYSDQTAVVHVKTAPPLPGRSP